MQETEDSKETNDTQQLGRYTLVAELGRGAMGAVYRAIDPLIERAVAIKTINLSLSRAEREEFERRFYSEAKSAGRLSHPNIVTVYDIGHNDSVAYIAMEYLEGQSLRALLDSGIVLSFDKIIDIAVQVADGLACAHDNHIVHRDIKPANIMVLGSGVVKITDFGVALIPAGSRTTAGTTMGSPAYMSPEQIVSGNVDGRSDIYGLGVVLYEMLTGRVPFGGDNVSAVMHRVLNEPAPAPSAVNAAVPATLDAVVVKALAKQADERYQTAAELAEDLRRLHGQLNSGSGTGLVMGMAPVTAAAPAGPSDDTAIMLGLPDIPVAGTAAPEANREAGLDLPEIPVSASGGESTAGGAKKKRLAYIALAAVVAVTALLALLRAPGPSSKADGQVAKQEAGQVAANAEAPVPVQPPADTAAKPAGASTTPSPAADGKQPINETASAPSTEHGPAERRPAEKQPADAAQAAGYLLFSVSPWAEVYVDGKKRGVSPPLTRLSVSPGKHTVELKNASLPVFRQEIAVEPKANVKIKHKFQ